ncbi:uncharacterized protein [Rutidosis leptorrhynchoides]|uniref:uncharacterized protein n=1 Tax=Rutidosis leptorrhynchoides TaxID=125765 RepID=UPI003A9A43DD
MAGYGVGIIILGCVMVLNIMVVPCLATVYTVGDSSGWTLGVDYATWAADKTFKVGDSLVFNYGSGSHTVEEVSDTDYKGCTTGNSINSDNSGKTTVDLKTAGTLYFMCGVMGHCGTGMKLAITVAAAQESGAPSSTTPTTTTTATPPSSATTSNNIPSAGTTTPSIYTPAFSSGNYLHAPLNVRGKKIINFNKAVFFIEDCLIRHSGIQEFKSKGPFISKTYDHNCSMNKLMIDGVKTFAEAFLKTVDDAGSNKVDT